MELHQLECFVRTAELGSFTKAAERLHISQPALSKNISLLENSLDVKLFDRNGKRFTLSATGKQVLELAKSILDETQQIKLLCRAQKSSGKRVALRMMCADDLFPDILRGFRSAHPDIQVTLLPVLKLTEDEDSDILVFSTIDEHHQAAFRTVASEELRYLVPPDHPLYGKQFVTLQEIAAYKIISLRELTDLRTLEDYFYAAAGVEPKRDIICDNPSALQALLRTGFGVAMVPTRTWDVSSGTDNRLIPISGFQCLRYINVHIPAPEKASREIQALFSYLIDFFADFNQKPEAIETASAP